ncbi:MAG TPA: hypothetical protein PKU97_18080 [Kofleriaceae bacterium]|nr:hypothetical protein [Kofleriaceae bacterium]
MLARPRLHLTMALLLVLPGACKDSRPSRFAQLQGSAAGDAPGATGDAPGATGATGTPTAWPALDEELLAASAATMRFRLGTPAPLAITPQGAVLYRRTGARERVADLYELPAGSDQPVLLASAAALLAGGVEQLSDAEKARRERTRTSTRGVVDISMSQDGRRILAPVGERLFVLDRLPADQVGAPAPAPAPGL